MKPKIEDYINSLKKKYESVTVVFGYVLTRLMKKD